VEGREREREREHVCVFWRERVCVREREMKRETSRERERARARCLYSGYNNGVMHNFKTKNFEKNWCPLFRPDRVIFFYKTPHGLAEICIQTDDSEPIYFWAPFKV